MKELDGQYYLGCPSSLHFDATEAKICKMILACGRADLISTFSARPDQLIRSADRIKSFEEKVFI
jgi:hypothetical protein